MTNTILYEAVPYARRVAAPWTVSVLFAGVEVSTEPRDSAADARLDADVETLPAVVRRHGEMARPTSSAAAR